MEASSGARLGTSSYETLESYIDESSTVELLLCAKTPAKLLSEDTTIVRAVALKARVFFSTISKEIDWCAPSH